MISGQSFIFGDDLRSRARSERPRHERRRSTTAARLDALPIAVWV